jgi:hypothetical protein
MKTNLKLLAAVIPLALTIACTDAAKAPAEAAMKAAETAIGGLKGEVMKLAPDQVKAAQDALAGAKDMIARQDYKGALATAGRIPAQVQAAVTAAAAKKDELLNAWNEASGSLPKMVEAIQSRLQVLSKAKKLPAGLDKAGLAKAKEGVAAIESGLASAAEQAKSGAFAEATAAANGLKAKCAEITKAIGMAP